MAMSADAAAPLPSPQQRSEGIAARRGVVLVLMSALIPGSAQLTLGNRKVGRIALRTWLIVIALLLLVGLGVIFFRSAVISLYANPYTLSGLLVFTVLATLGWIALVVDAWRLARPAAMSQRGKLLTGILTLALVLGGGAVGTAAAVSFGTQARVIGGIFTGGGIEGASDGRYNVLLMGGDAGSDRVGMRPDTMMVASIDAETGRTVLFSLPRNLQWAPFPEDNPLHEKYPDGYWCKSQECLLNAVYMLAEENKSLFPDEKYPGAVATADVVGEILGLRINYWAMIDLAGFEALIDAVGGIRLDINKRIPIGSLSGPKGVYDWIEPGKNVHLDGWNALWFARSREYASDYERMARQKCVMNAMLKQLNPATLAAKFTDIAAASEKVVATNMPSSQIGTMLELALKAKALPMSSVNFSPPLIKPAKPDFEKILTVVQEKIAASEAKDVARAGGATGGATTTGSQQTSTPKASPKASATTSSGTVTQTDDLDEVCSVS